MEVTFSDRHGACAEGDRLGAERSEEEERPRPFCDYRTEGRVKKKKKKKKKR